jgi:transcriptional regulator with XRE-family HTH domain
MDTYNDFALDTSQQIEKALCKRIETIRLSRNLTQRKLAEESGISLSTVRRLEKGVGVSLDTFIRVMKALGIQHNLEALLPDPTIRPVERIGATAKERKRARSSKSSTKRKPWVWKDGVEDDE